MAYLWLATHRISGKQAYIICDTPQQAGAAMGSYANVLEGDSVRLERVGGGFGEPAVLIRRESVLGGEEMNVVYRETDGGVEDAIRDGDATD